MLVRDLDTVRVRNAIRAEILAILRDMGLNPSPTPPHKPKRPHLRRYNGSRKGPVPNAGAGLDQRNASDHAPEALKLAKPGDSRRPSR
jgi:hypothetical protein